MPDHKRKFVPLIISAVLFVLVLCASLLLGAQRLSLSEFISDRESFSRIVLMQIRLPRAILAVVSGALLAGAGAAFQMFFRNPLAEPGIMGISSGATLGATAAMCVTGAGTGRILSPVSAGAFLGALAAGFLVTGISTGQKSSALGSTTAILLCGTALGSFYSACTSIILSLDSARLNVMYVWMLGSFSGRGWSEAAFIILPSAIAVMLLSFCAKQLDILFAGEIPAMALGVEVRRLRLLVIVTGAVAASAAVCAGGTIGFVGLVAPHVMRQIFGPRARSLIPLSMLGGATLLLAADTISRIVIPPSEIPVGTVTALIGAPFFISLLISGSKGSRQ